MPEQERTYVEREFDVGAPGKPLTSGRSKRMAVKIAAIVAPAVLVGGGGFLVGVSVGSSRVPAANEIQPEQAEKYGLTDFPVDQAVAFGQQYLAKCLSHPAADDKAAIQQRQDQLIAMSAAAGISPSCGWDGKGEAVAAPTIVYAGTWSPVDEVKFESGRAAYVDYVGYTSKGAVGYSVPVWVASDPSQGMRVAGDIGIVPVAASPEVPKSTDTLTVDPAIGGSLIKSVLTPFFAAWSVSDATQLQLVTTTDATTRALTGLAGAVGVPEVATATAYTSKTVETGQTPEYIEGDEIDVQTAVTWTSESGASQLASYRVTLRLVEQRWLIYDIQGSTANGSGGQTPAEPESTSTSESEPSN